MTAAWLVGYWHEHLGEVFQCSTMHAPVSDDLIGHKGHRLLYASFMTSIGLTEVNLCPSDFF